MYSIFLKQLVKLSIVLSVIVSVIPANAYAVKSEDPLRPPEFKIKKVTPVITGKKAVSKPAGWLVREILFSGKRRVAIVNNVAVSKGDRINGAKVIDIKPRHVVLNYKDKTIKAPLRSVSVKTRAK